MLYEEGHTFTRRRTGPRMPAGWGGLSTSASILSPLVLVSVEILLEGSMSLAVFVALPLSLLFFWGGSIDTIVSFFRSTMAAG